MAESYEGRLPRGPSASLGAALQSISIMVGEQITVEQLTELSIVMRISRYDHVYRHHVQDK